MRQSAFLEQVGGDSESMRWPLSGYFSGAVPARYELHTLNFSREGLFRMAARSPFESDVEYLIEIASRDSKLFEFMVAAEHREQAQFLAKLINESVSFPTSPTVEMPEGFMTITRPGLISHRRG